MFGKKSAIKKYQRKLPEELSKRYGGNGPYTPEQVKATVDDMGLNHRFIHFAYLMYCSQAAMAGQGIDASAADEMQAEIDQASTGGLLSAPLDGMAGGGDGGDGGGLDGGI
ncbi:MAG: DUF6559 family protein [Pseudomonadales bacterium]